MGLCLTFSSDISMSIDTGNKVLYLLLKPWMENNIVGQPSKKATTFTSFSKFLFNKCHPCHVISLGLDVIDVSDIIDSQSSSIFTLSNIFLKISFEIQQFTRYNVKNSIIKMCRYQKIIPFFWEDCPMSFDWAEGL